MDRCGSKHVELKPEYWLKLNQCNHIVYLVGLYIFTKNDTRTLQCQGTDCVIYPILSEQPWAIQNAKVQVTYAETVLQYGFHLFSLVSEGNNICLFYRHVHTSAPCNNISAI